MPRDRDSRGRERRDREREKREKRDRPERKEQPDRDRDRGRDRDKFRGGDAHRVSDRQKATERDKRDNEREVRERNRERKEDKREKLRSPDINSAVDRNVAKHVNTIRKSHDSKSTAKNTIKERFSNQRKSWDKDSDNKATSPEKRRLHEAEDVRVKIKDVKPLKLDRPDYKIEPHGLTEDAYDEAKEKWELRDEVSEPVMKDYNPVTPEKNDDDRNTNVRTKTDDTNITGIDIAKKIEENQDWSETSRAYLLNKKRNTGGIFGLDETKMGSKSKGYANGLRGLFGRGR